MAVTENAQLNVILLGRKRSSANGGRVSAILLIMLSVQQHPNGHRPHTRPGGMSGLSVVSHAQRSNASQPLKLKLSLISGGLLSAIIGNLKSTRSDNPTNGRGDAVIVTQTGRTNLGGRETLTSKVTVESGGHNGVNRSYSSQKERYPLETFL
jgi:hypothetical protein